MSAQPSCWQVVGDAHLRASAHADYVPPGWPGLTGDTPDTWRSWLEAVWEEPEIAAAIRHASPALASRAEDFLRGTPLRLARARRVVAAVLRYVLRAQHRLTPFGLFAGVTTGQWGEQNNTVWNGHRVFASPAGSWVTDAVSRLEASFDLLRHSEVVANATATVHDDGQLLIPQVARPEAGHPLATTLEVRLRYTSAVRAALAAARSPAPWQTVVEAVRATHPQSSAEDITFMLAQLVWAGALITNLSPPSTTAPLDHLEATLRGMGLAGAVEAKKAHRARQALAEFNTHHGSDSTAVEEAMGDLSPALPLGVDLRLDADINFPRTIARAAEEAMDMVETLNPHRDGLETWRGYRERFTDLYGTGTLVPVTEVVAPSGVGYPHWSEPTTPTATARDRWLLEHAQAAALDHANEVDAADLLDLMRGEEHAPVVGHTEMNLRLESPTPAALDSGRFRLAVLGVSRTAVTMAGRFTTMTDSADQLRTALTSTPGPVPVQLSFPPHKARSAHVARVPPILDQVFSVAEHPVPGALGVHDLAVGCDDDGLFLWSHTLGCRIHPVVPHALNLRYAPTLVRFLAELPRAEHMPNTDFSWGAASRLPFLPRLRSGRIVLSPARWRVRPNDLPPARAPWATWDEAWMVFADRRRIPTRVELGASDQRLRLDLSEADHRYLLRTHLDTMGTATLREAPDPRAFGWCGRPTEILLQLTRKGDA